VGPAPFIVEELATLRRFGVEVVHVWVYASAGGLVVQRLHLSQMEGVPLSRSGIADALAWLTASVGALARVTVRRVTSPRPAVRQRRHATRYDRVSISR
jgi:hypothetical protein